MTLPSAVREFVEDLTAAVVDVLGERLVGVYLIGSSALDDFQATSDIDVVAVSVNGLPTACQETLRDRVLDLANHVPARGLEFILYSTAQAGAADGTVTLNLNAGPAMTTQIGTTEDFWFTIDASILRQTAVALVGPPPRCPPRPPPLLCAASAPPLGAQNRPEGYGRGTMGGGSRKPGLTRAVRVPDGTANGASRL